MEILMVVLPDYDWFLWPCDETKSKLWVPVEFHLARFRDFLLLCGVERRPFSGVLVRRRLIQVAGMAREKITQ